MLKLKEDIRDQIVNFLATVSSPPAIGASLMQIIGALNALEKIDDSTPEETKE